MNERNDLTFKESKISNGMILILFMTLIYSALSEWQEAWILAATVKFVL